MFCAWCGQETEAAPCSDCGHEPALDGRYRLVESLTWVGVGQTWRAERLPDGREMAVTCVGAPEGLDAHARALFTQEMALLQRMRHAGIPRVLEGFEGDLTGGMCLVVVQEWEDGGPIAMRKHREDEALAVLEAVLPALAYVHSLSPPLVHQNLCLNNLVRRAADGGISLVGFGAGAAAHALEHSLASRWPYRAPELCEGRCGPAADLYGLGASLLALLRGREPFDLLDDDGHLRWRDQVAVSEGTRLLLELLLEPEPHKRLVSTSHALALVRAARAGEGAEALMAELAAKNAGALLGAGTPAPTDQRTSDPVFLTPDMTLRAALPPEVRRRLMALWILVVGLGIAMTLVLAWTIYGILHG